MSPLIPIAVNLLPDLAKRLAGKDMAQTVTKVESIVRTVLGTDDPVAARLAAEDPAKAAELRIRLAEIEAEADAERARADLARQEAARQAQKDALDAALVQQDAKLKELQTHLASQADARSHAAAAAEKGSIYAWGPIVMSTIVTVGFFILLTMLIRGTFQGDQAVLQIINIGFGTLTAGFATVISFWLGSSDSSRQKDVTNAALQAQRAMETRAIFDRQSQQAEAILAQTGAQTSALIRKVDRTAPAAAAPAQQPPADAKGPRQFRRCVDLVLAQEALVAGAPDDARAPVRLGVTAKALAAWRGAEVAPDALDTLEPEEARQILRGQIWNALGCQDLPQGLDLAVFDLGVESGVLIAAKALQSLVSVETDGQVGPVTLSAVRQFDAAGLLDDLRDLRRRIADHSPAAARLGRRIDAIHDAARAMLA